MIPNACAKWLNRQTRQTVLDQNSSRVEMCPGGDFSGRGFSERKLDVLTAPEPKDQGEGGDLSVDNNS